MAAQAHLIILEPSKVRSYHSTLMDGLIRAYGAAGLRTRYGTPSLYAHESFFANLSEESRRRVDYHPIPVMDQDRRRLIRKALLEAWTVVRAMIRAGHDDVILTTTLMPPAMILVEIAKWLMPRKRLVVLQHGELEGAFEKHRQRLGSFGFYILLWLRLRRLGSTVKVAVLDEFIASEVSREFGASILARDLAVLPLPMTADPAGHAEPDGAITCCFIGFQTKNKGYNLYLELAHMLPDLRFRVIGGGENRLVGEEVGTPIGASGSFLAAIEQCDIAIFPYTGGYRCSLSAAATDAIAAGLHLLATDRPCFLALQEAFGPESVTVCRSIEEMHDRLSDLAWLAARRKGRQERLSRVAASRYGPAGVASAIEAILLDAERPAVQAGLLHVG